MINCYDFVKFKTKDAAIKKQAILFQIIKRRGRVYKCLRCFAYHIDLQRREHNKKL